MATPGTVSRWFLLLAIAIFAAVLLTKSPSRAANTSGRPQFAVLDTDELAEVATSHTDAIKKRVIFGSFEEAKPVDFLLKHVLQFARATFEPGTSINMHYHKDMSETFYVLDGEGYVDVEHGGLGAREMKTFHLMPSRVVSLGRFSGHRFYNNATGKDAKPLTLLYFALRE